MSLKELQQEAGPVGFRTKASNFDAVVTWLDKSSDKDKLPRGVLKESKAHPARGRAELDQLATSLQNYGGLEGIEKSMALQCSAAPLLQ